MTNLIIPAIVALYLIWLFSEVWERFVSWLRIKLKIAHSAFSFEYERNEETSEEMAEFTSIKNGLTQCESSILLEKYWDDIISFKNQYQGNNLNELLMDLYSQKETELARLN